MFLHKLTDLLRSMFSREAIPCSRPSTTQPSLEELESRFTPSAAFPPYLVPPVYFESYTDATVQVTPNLFSGTVTETITATVTSTINGSLPYPSRVLFNLNNLSQSAQLNSNNQATASFTLPILALFTSQTLDVQYTGGERGQVVPFIVSPSDFRAPLYMNFDNLFLPAILSFGHLTQQQLNPTVDNTGRPTGLPSFNTAQGETENFGIFSFHYTDPGIIDSVTVGSMTLPGIFAFALDAYGGIPGSSNSK
jgi:hypothetical protein